MDLSQKISGFPNSAGVYLMKDPQGQILYVGKAKDLRKRVLTYFGKESTERYQVQFLMKRTADIDYLVTDSEKEALLLENTLIKKYKPRYNLQLRDDKSYLSLKLSIKERFPRITVTRQIKKDGSRYFGPYTSAAAARETADFIERYFRLRTCSDMEFANRVRPCLQYQIHRCDAPCVGWIVEASYRRIVEQVKLFLQGKKQDLLEILQNQMKEQSEREEFEKAAQTRDLITSISETLEKQKVDRHIWIDQDVIGLYREGERLTFCLLMVREGKVWESRLFHLKGHGEDEEVLDSFVTQFYDEGRFIPDEILVPSPFPSLDLLGQLLRERREKKIGITVPQRGDKSDLMELALRNAREGFQQRSKKLEEMSEVLGKLQERLPLKNFPRRMECFDISNISGKEAVGSLVSFVDGAPYKEGYRRFKIKTVHQPDDFSMMREVLRRRLTRLERASGFASASDHGRGVRGGHPRSGPPVEDKKWEKPDLIVIDGGKGQLSAVMAVMNELNVTGIDLIALAKKKGGEGQDKVFIPGRKNPILLERHSSLLHLLMRIRDEAHRFAITYHKKLRAKAFIPLLLFLAFQLIGHRAIADDSNYQNYPIGTRAAGMGGAHTAFSNSADGPFYNPGGIVFVKDDNLSVSANVVRYTKGKIKNAIVIGSVTQDLPFSAIDVIPTSAVALFPFNFWGSKDPETPKRNAFAFSFFTPDFINYSGKEEVTASGLGSFLTYQIQDQTFYIGPSYARKLSDRFGIGISLFYHYRIFNRSTFVTARNSSSFVEAFDGEDFTYGAFVPIIGAKLALPHHLHMGLSIRPNSIRLNNDGEIFRSQATDGAASATNPTKNVAKTLSINLPSPFKITGGIGYDNENRFAISGDVSFYLPNSFLAIHDPSGQFGDLRIKQRLVVNGNVGAEYYLKKNLPLRAGFFTNFSAAPTPDAGTGGNSSRFDSIGGTVSISIEDKHTETQFGFLISDGSGVIRTGNTNNDFSLLQMSAVVSSLYRF